MQSVSYFLQVDSFIYFDYKLASHELIYRFTILISESLKQ